MSLRLAAIALLLLFGCSRPTGAPSLVFKSIGLNESAVPMAFGVRVHNVGNGPARVDGLAIRVLRKVPICSPGDAARDPKDFDCAVWLLNGDKPLVPGMALAIKPGDTAELHCFLEWKLPADAPAMLAMIDASFSLNQGDVSLVQTERWRSFCKVGRAY